MLGYYMNAFMPVLKTLSLTSMSNDLLKELTEKSTSSATGKENFIISNVEKSMVCLDNGFPNEQKSSSHLAPARRNFIPYPDHNYGQPPPLTPPNPASPDPNEQTDTGNEDEDEEGITRCICGFDHDDGYMICCDKCSAWQHIECMGITSDNVPEKYFCDKCEPRVLDADKAKAIQSKKREEMSDDDDDDEETDTDDEVPATSYTAVSNTPTRITLTANVLRSRKKARSHSKTKGDGDQLRKRKRNSKKRSRTDTNGNDSLLNDSNSLDSYIGYETYQPAAENHYDNGLMNIHLQLPESTVNGFTDEDKEKKYVLCDVQENRRGLVASCTIETGTWITEFKGIVMLLSTFEETNTFFKKSYPYVLYYNGLDHIELVIDARTYGSDARFIRRSCTANAEVQHIYLGGKLHFFILSKQLIPKDTEITIPFDYPLESYTGYVECACRQVSCPAFRKNQQYLLQSSSKRIKYENGQIKDSSLPGTEGQVETESDDNEVDVGSTDRPISRRKKMSREERKLQAYLKQIEKMEKKEKEVVTKTPIKMPPQTDENCPLRSSKMGRRAPGRRKVSLNKRRSRLSSCSSEPLSPDNNDSNSASTPTTPVPTSNANPQAVDQNGQIKQKVKREREPLTLTLTLDKSKDTVKKIRRDYVETVAGSPTPPSTPGQLSPAIRSANTVTETHQTALSIDVTAHSVPYPNNAPQHLSVNGALDKRLNGLLQIADQADSVSSSSGSPHPYYTVSNGMATSEEVIGDLMSRDGYLPAPEPDLSSVIARMRSEKRCRYFGSLKKHWLRQHERRAPSPNRPLNGITALSLETLMSDFTIRNRANQIASSLFKVPKSNIPLKKRRLKDAMEEPKLDQRSLANKSKEGNDECNMVVSQGKAIYRSRSGSFSHSMRDSKKMLLTEYEKHKSEALSEGDKDTVFSESPNAKNVIDYQFADIERTSSKLHTEPNEGESKPLSTGHLNDGNLVLVSSSEEKAPAAVGDPRFSSTSSRESFDSCTFSRSDSISSLEDSIGGKSELNKRCSTSGDRLDSGNLTGGKKKMSLIEYRNRQRTKPATTTGSSSISQPVETAVSITMPQTSSSLLNATDSLLTPRTLSLSASFPSHQESDVKETSPVASVTSVPSAGLSHVVASANGPVFEPVSPSEDEEHATKDNQGMHYVSRQNFIFPSTTTIASTASVLHQYHPRNIASNADGSSSDAMEIEDDDVGSANKIVVGVPHLETTRSSVTENSITHGKHLPVGQQVMQQQYSGKASGSPYYSQHVLQWPLHSQDYQPVKPHDNRTPSSRSSQTYSQQFRG